MYKRGDILIDSDSTIGLYRIILLLEKVCEEKYWKLIMFDEDEIYTTWVDICEIELFYEKV